MLVFTFAKGIIMREFADAASSFEKALKQIGSPLNNDGVQTQFHQDAGILQAGKSTS